VTVPQKSNDIRQRALAAALVANDCDEFLIQWNDFLVKPFSTAVGVTFVTGNAKESRYTVSHFRGLGGVRPAPRQ